jgi:hypothetical protein
MHAACTAICHAPCTIARDELARAAAVPASCIMAVGSYDSLYELVRARTLYTACAYTVYSCRSLLAYDARAMRA